MYPSTISTFNIVSASDRLNSPSHSALHNSVSSVLTQVQTVIGTDTASALGTIIGDLRNPASGGGGHVQTANKGGTGQTTFTKGDLLVATGPSTLSKLAIGSDGQILIANSSVASGINWAANSSNKIHASVLSSVICTDTVAESSIFSVSIPGSILGTNNVIRATVNVVDMMFQNAASSVMLMGIYGGARVASVLVDAATAGTGAGLRGKIEFDLFGNGSQTAQSGDLSVSLARSQANQSSMRGVFAMQTGVSSVASTGNQTLGITSKYSTDNSGGIRIGGIIIQKIV